MQLSTAFLALSIGVSAATAAPFTSFLQARAAVNAAPEEQVESVWKIHESCNGTQRAQISRGVSDMKKLAHNAINHILNHPMDDYFTTYFGDKADPAPVLGYYQQLVYVSTPLIPHLSLSGIVLTLPPLSPLLILCGFVGVGRQG